MPRLGNLTVKMKGQDVVTLHISNIQRNILAGQFSTGRELLTYTKRRAQRIIKQRSAPVTTGELSNSLTITAQQTSGGGVRQELYAGTAYARKVHSGRPMEKARANAKLLYWVKNNLGEKAARSVQRRGHMTTGAPSSRRKYHPQIGMRFFDEPFVELGAMAPEKYEMMVAQAIAKNS